MLSQTKSRSRKSEKRKGRKIEEEAMKEDVKLVIKRSLEHFSSVNLWFSIVSNSHQ